MSGSHLYKEDGEISLNPPDEKEEERGNIQSVKYMLATGLPGIIAPPTIWMRNCSEGIYPTVA